MLSLAWCPEGGGPDTSPPPASQHLTESCCESALDAVDLAESMDPECEGYAPHRHWLPSNQANEALGQTQGGESLTTGYKLLGLQHLA
jgi:hypothetical protein